MPKSDQEPASKLQKKEEEPTDQPFLPGLPGLQAQGIKFELQSSMHIGPVPQPQTLSGYGEIDKTFPDRIMRMAEENAETGRKTAERAQTFALAERMVARILGLTFALGSVGLSAYLALQGHDAVAGVIGGTTVIAVTTALIAGKAP